MSAAHLVKTFTPAGSLRAIFAGGVHLCARGLTMLAKALVRPGWVDLQAQFFRTLEPVKQVLESWGLLPVEDRSK